MSLPLTRRIARAALLVAAGAAPLVGAAGPAQAGGPPESTGLGGVSNLDSASLGDTLDGTARQAPAEAAEAAETARSTTESALPAAGELLGQAAPHTGTPAAERTVTGAGELAGALTRDAVGAHAGGLPVPETARGLTAPGGAPALPESIPATEDIRTPATPDTAEHLTGAAEAARALTADGPVRLGV